MQILLKLSIRILLEHVEGTMAATMRETVGWIWDTDVHLRPARTGRWAELARERFQKKMDFTCIYSILFTL